jgi:branched-chain amino acid aminotransferase
MQGYYSWYNGDIDLTGRVQISSTDLGYLRGYGLFDYFRTYQRKVFQWDWYWERFENSARLLKIPLKYSKSEIYEIMIDLKSKTNKPEVAFRFVLTGGDSPDSSTMVSPNLLIRTEPIVEMDKTLYEKGISIITHQYVRDMPEIKTTDYKRLMFLQEEIKNAGASDVLYHTKGVLSELSRSNLFIVKDGIIKTPKTGVLKGITRRTIIELAKPEFQIQEMEVDVSDLITADEVFTTSSNKKVMPITKIDGKQIGNGSCGKVTKELLNKFIEFTHT